MQHRPQLPVQQLSPERIVVGGGPAGAARRAEREQAGGLKVRSHFDLQLGGQAQEHRDVMMRDVPPCRRRHRRGGNSGRHTTYDTSVESKRLGATQRNVNHRPLECSPPAAVAIGSGGSTPSTTASGARRHD